MPEPTSAAEDQGARNGRRKSSRVPLLLLVAVVIFAVGYGIYWVLVGRWSVSTDDAYVHGDTINLSAQKPGTVVAVDAALTQYVRQGQTVVRLDDIDARVKLSKAEADLAQTVRRTAQLYQMADVDAAVVTQRDAQLKQAKADLARDRKLVPVNGVSKQALQRAETAYAQAQAALDQARHQLAAARTATANTDVADHPQVKQAEAQVRAAWVALARTRIPAPVSGYVAQKNVQVGQQATPGKPLLAIVPLEDVYVDANFKENQLAELRIGQPVTLTADLYGSDVSYHGKVVGFSSGTGASLSVLPPQNASGNWIKVVQRLPVRIALDPKELARHPLMLGLSMSVDVDIHHEDGSMLSRQPTFDGTRTTDVYATQTQGVEAVIRGIVAANLPASVTSAMASTAH